MIQSMTSRSNSSRLAALGVAVLLTAGLLAPVHAASKKNLPNLVGTAIAVNQETGEFSTLIAAVLAADLAPALSTKRQLTVFAPTDAAFAELGLNADNVGELPKDVLTDILLYHVTHGVRQAVSIVNARQVRMLNGDLAYPSVQEGSVYVNDSRVVAANVRASNGVIHVIDAVLLPSTEN
jgi:uncharacterized surface protein with fasciclin (FAS1) repeats